MHISKTNKTSFIAGAGSVVLLGAALMPGLVGAQTATETATAEATGTASVDHVDGVECGPGMAALRGIVRLHVGEDIAAALGVTTDELRAAATEVREAYADTERPTTEEERDALQAEVKSAFAAALGISVDELDAAQEQVKAEKQADAIARVNEALANGTITHEQADAMIERIEAGEGAFGLRGDGFHGGRGGRGFGEPGGGFGGGLFGGATPAVTPDA